MYKSHVCGIKSHISHMYAQDCRSIFRYIHVCHPLKAMKWCRIKIANKVVLGIVIVSVVYNIPRFFEYYKILQVRQFVSAFARRHYSTYYMVSHI